MLVGLAVLFGGTFILIGAWNDSDVAGRVEITRADGTVALEPFGCMADRLKDELVISLEDAEPKDGFHEENRAIVFADHSDQGETRTARPVEGLTVAYRNENKEVVAIDCTSSKNTLTIQTARRSGAAAGRRSEDRWNGEYKASCKLGDDTYNVDISMENCD